MKDLINKLVFLIAVSFVMFGMFLNHRITSNYYKKKISLLENDNKQPIIISDKLNLFKRVYKEDRIVREKSPVNLDNMDIDAIKPFYIFEDTNNIHIYTRSYMNELKMREMNLYLLRSLNMFWPYKKNLIIVLDDEREEDHKLGKTLEHEFQVYFEKKPKIFPEMKGHSRQQGSYFYCDKYIENEEDYIAMVDTDTIFTQPADKELLFNSKGKPYIIGLVGQPHKGFWANVPSSTKMSLNKRQVFRAMSYFPIIVKAKHLRMLREYILKVHNKDNFDELWPKFGHAYDKDKKIITYAFATFNIICNYLYYFHFDEYEFRFQSITDNFLTFNDTRRGANVGDDYYKEILNAKNTLPLPRVSLHGGTAMHKFKLSHLSLKRLQQYETVSKQLLFEGYCISGGLFLNNHAKGPNNKDKYLKELCNQNITNNLKDYLENFYTFEESNWLYDSERALKQLEHYFILKWNRLNISQPMKKYFNL